MNWYCIHTQPKKEESARQYYDERLGLETYYPKLRELRVIRRVKKYVVRPLFPRYLFCRYESAVYYRAVRYAPDVIDVIRTGEVPIIVPDRLIASMQSWANDTLEVGSRYPLLKAGDAVVIEEGPLMGMQAIVERDMSGSDRVALLLSILDCEARTVVTRSQLRLVS